MSDFLCLSEYGLAARDEKQNHIARSVVTAAMNTRERCGLSALLTHGAFTKERL
jgi:hypothetical protein